MGRAARIRIGPIGIHSIEAVFEPAFLRRAEIQRRIVNVQFTPAGWNGEIAVVPGSGGFAVHLRLFDIDRGRRQIHVHVPRANRGQADGGGET